MWCGMGGPDAPWFQLRRPDLARINLIRRISNLQSCASLRSPLRAQFTHALSSVLCFFLCGLDMVTPIKPRKLNSTSGRKTVLIHS